MHPSPSAVVDLLDRLQSIDVRLRVEDGRLRVSAPAGVLTPELKAELKTQKDALQRLLMDLNTSFNPIRPRPVELKTEAPASFAQQRMWLLHELDPENPAYHIPFALQFDGVLDREALNAAFTTVSTRHEALRTHLYVAGGALMQRIEPSVRIPLSYVDVTSEAPDARETAAVERMRRDVVRPFDLTEAPLMRALLIRLAPDSHQLLLTTHHAVSDAWSMRVLVDELTIAYAAFAHGRMPELPELPVQYADYAVWQHEHLTGDRLDRDLDYWTRRLDAAPRSDLPTRQERPPGARPASALARASLPATVSRAVQALARRHKTTPFVVFLAAFKVLLARYSGESDVSVGTPVAGRTDEAVEGLVGCFVNTLVLRTDVGNGNGVTFADVVRRVHATVRDAQAHQQVPFERVVEALAPQDDPSRHPLVQTLFTHATADAASVTSNALSSAGGEVAVSTVDVDASASMVDASLLVAEQPDATLQVKFEYDPDLFGADFADRLLAHYGDLLASLVVAPTTPLADVTRLAEDERERLLADAAAPAQVDAQPAYVAPRTHVEEQLVRIWESVLGVSPIGVEDDFFERGGTSLLAITLMSEIEKRMGEFVPLRAIVQGRTIDSLSTLLSERSWLGSLRADAADAGVARRSSRDRRVLVELTPSHSNSGPPLFFAAPLGGILPSTATIGLVDLAHVMGDDQPFYSLHAPPFANELADALHATRDPKAAHPAHGWTTDAQALPDVAARCVEAMRRVRPHGPYHVAGFCTGGFLAFEIASQLQEAGEEVGLLAMLDTWIDDEYLEMSEILHRVQSPTPQEIATFVRSDLAWEHPPERLDGLSDELAARDPADRWEHAAHRLYDLGVVAPDTPSSKMRHLFEMKTIDGLLVRFVLDRYVARPFDGAITLVLDDTYAGVDPATLEQETHVRHFSTQPPVYRFVPGGSRRFLEPHIHPLADTFASSLAAAHESHLASSS